MKLDLRDDVNIHELRMNRLSQNQNDVKSRKDVSRRYFYITVCRYFLKQFLATCIRLKTQVPVDVQKAMTRPSQHTNTHKNTYICHVHNTKTIRNIHTIIYMYVSHFCVVL